MLLNFSVENFMRKILTSLLLLFLFACPVNMAQANGAQQSIPSVLIYALAEDTINGLLEKADGSVYTLECLTRLPDAMIVPVGNLALEPEVVGTLRYNAPVQVRVAIKVNGLQQMNIVTAWRIKKVVNVLVAARDIPSRTILSATDVYFEQREVTKIDDVIYDVDSIIGLETKRPITSGTTLSKSMLMKPFVVRSGDNVAIVSRAGSIVVQAAGQALQGGAVGDVIRVRNLGSGKTVLARIESENTVVISAVTR